MKTKSGRILSILACVALATLLLMGILASCAAKAEIAAPNDSSYLSYRAEHTEPAHYYDGDSYDGYYGNVALQNMIDYSLSSEKELAGGGAAPTSWTTTRGDAADRYVITTADFTIQTKTYDAFAAALKADLRTMGGYTNSFDEWNYDSGRRASVVARVPSQQLEAFLDNLRKNGTVVNESQRNSDVTDEMIETGSRKEALKNEETALLDILEKAKNVEEIIIVQDRLSRVRADLQAYSQKLQSLQNQVSYSTVNIDVREVDRITTPTQKFSTLASTGFLASLREIGSGLRDFALWFISAIPYLVLLAIPTVIIVIIVRRVRRNKKAKKAGMQA